MVDVECDTAVGIQKGQTMNLIEEQERRQEINDVLDRYPVPTKYEDLQRANEERATEQISTFIAIAVIIAAAVWFLWR